MNLTRSSKGAVLAILLAVSLAAVGTAAAVSVTGNAPDPAQTGEEITVEMTVEEPFRDAPDQWTLEGSTELKSASWTVQVLAQGDPVDTIDAGNESFTYDLDSETGATEVQIEVSGTVPSLNSFDYQDIAAENYTAVSVARVSDGTSNELGSFDSHRYTEDSREARQAIDSAIESVGGTNDKIKQAISAYDSANFGNAVSLAEEAESGAQSSQLLLIGAGVVVLLVIVGAGFYVWRQRQNTGHKLQ